MREQAIHAIFTSHAALPSGPSLPGFLRVLNVAALAMLAITLVACSSGSAPAQQTDEPGELTTGVASTEQPDQESQTLVPGSLSQLQDDPNLLGDIPEIVASETLAATGLQVAYTHLDQMQSAPALFIESQWVYMQTCLQQNAAAPVVVVQRDRVQPFMSSDDVIRNIDGTAIASSSTRAVSLIQILESDFDGTLGNVGFNTRSIMGRLLWLSANLPERDYPFDCARTAPAS